MRQRGTPPDVFSFNGVMQANVGGGNWASALEVWPTMRTQKLDLVPPTISRVDGG